MKIAKVFPAWGGDLILLAIEQGERKVIIGRCSREIYGTDAGLSAKDITRWCKGKTLEELREFHYEDVQGDKLEMTATLKDAMTKWPMG